MGFDDYKNKVVVVSGAASGIGAAICRRFARGGAKIGLLDINEKIEIVFLKIFSSPRYIPIAFTLSAGELERYRKC